MTYMYIFPACIQRIVVATSPLYDPHVRISYIFPACIQRIVVATSPLYDLHVRIPYIFPACIMQYYMCSRIVFIVDKYLFRIALKCKQLKYLLIDFNILK